MDGNMMSPQTGFDPKGDPRGFRDALGRFATGVTVITALGPEGPVGITANSFASVSLDPALVLWSPAKGSRRFPIFTGAEHYVIHVLAADQRHVCDAFVRNAGAFDSLPTRDTDHGVPVIQGCLAHFECRQVAVHDAGDHAIIVGQVTACNLGDGDPLIFAAGGYGGFTRG